MQKTRKDGHLKVKRLQFLCRDQRRLRLPRVAVDSQPCDLPMTNFLCLLQHKGAPILQTKQPLFWKKRQICASLPDVALQKNKEANEEANAGDFKEER